jgi:cell division protein FtsN
MYGLAQRKVLDDGNLRIMIGDRLLGKPPTQMPTTGPVNAPPQAPAPGTSIVRGTFSVQVGAFSAMSTAQREASRFGGLGATRIETLVQRGKTLYVVKVGQYRTRAEADQVRRNAGRDARVVQN